LFGRTIGTTYVGIVENRCKDPIKHHKSDKDMHFDPSAEGTKKMISSFSVK
jgi:hypothetical protein